MKTDISTFCQESLDALSPLPLALQITAEEMARLGTIATTGRTLPLLNDVRARLRSLVEKLQSQQAYLLIFGPLKSGKSTLVNALSGAYVSEVTSLPGYPCLVYVQNGEQPRFALTRYNGRESVFPSANVLKEVIEDSHVALAQQIRAAENREQPFDPAIDFPEAIRRVDVKVPVPNLANSNTAVVDTPGLYSRMNFGYDVLTREFRNSAACAVFVVKTDNLFLEQVFVEFDQLLGLFSRIFLVINVDSSKRDLQPDGVLRPSAESADPSRVVEAFTTLSMSGPLRKAYEQNRVRIHALDLMNAASAVLHPEGADAVARQRFDAFVADLTAYLNSSEYTLEFVRDSLRQARHLCGELRDLSAAGEIRSLRDRQDALALEMRILDHRIGSVDRLAKIDWPATFEGLRQDASERAQKQIADEVAKTGEATRTALDGWAETTESLKELEENRWDPLLIHAGLHLAEETRAFLAKVAAEGGGGAQPNSESMEDLHRIGVNLSSVAVSALGNLSPIEPLEDYLIHLAIDEVPIAKSWGERFLFRRAAGIRRRVFGEDLSLAIPLEEKRFRLPVRSLTYLRNLVAETVQMKFSSLAPEQAARSIQSYIEAFCVALQQALQFKREQFVQARATLQREFDSNAGVVDLMLSLERQVLAADKSLQKLEATEEGGRAAVVRPAAMEGSEAAYAEGGNERLAAAVA